jgi:inorganic pyrophosphatase
MQRKVIYRDYGGIRRTMIWEDDTPLDVTVLTESNMEATIEMNKIVREMHPRRGTNKLIARGVPITVAEKAMRENWDESDWAKWLNDPDNAAFRIWPGRV